MKLMASIAAVGFAFVASSAFAAGDPTEPRANTPKSNLPAITTYQTVKLINRKGVCIRAYAHQGQFDVSPTRHHWNSTKITDIASNRSYMVTIFKTQNCGGIGASVQWFSGKEPEWTVW